MPSKAEFYRQMAEQVSTQLVGSWKEWTAFLTTAAIRNRAAKFDMGNFTFEEKNLLCIYNTGSRSGLIDALTEMRGELSPEEAELRKLTDSALEKLQAMSDAEFAELELYPDFDE